MTKASDTKYINRTVVGFVEPVIIRGKHGKSRRVLARIDSGATKSSIDLNLAKELDIGPVVGQTTIKNANGVVTRDLVTATVSFDEQDYTEFFTLADRKNMKFSVLIGQNILEQGFLIDPDKNQATSEEE